MMTDLVLNCLVVVLLLLANGFFVASEFALVSARKAKILQLKDEGNLDAKIAFDALQDLDRYIAAIQLGITVASIGLGWVGEATIAGLIEPLFNFLPFVSKTFATHSIAVTIAFAAITILHVVIGELMPKAIALQYPVKVSLFVAKPMAFITKLFRPFIFILNGLGFFLLGFFKIKPGKSSHLAHSIEELNILINASYKEGVLNETEKNLLENVFKFSDLTAKQVMIPRTDMISIPSNITLEELKEINLEYQYTRYPVYEEDLDHIIGILHIKDFYILLSKDEPNIDISRIVRKPMLIPETVTIDNLVREFRKNHSQIAIVVDEFGGTSGLVTLEDIIEEIVGQVQDEFDEEEADIKEVSDGKYIVNAMLRLDELDRFFKLDIEQNEEDVETIAGLVVKKLGRICQIGDTVEIEGWLIKVLQIDGARILQLSMEKLSNKCEGDSSCDDLEEQNVSKDISIQQEHQDLSYNEKENHIKKL